LLDIEGHGHEGASTTRFLYDSPEPVLLTHRNAMSGETPFTAAP
jgi:hypothetical protein